MALYTINYLKGLSRNKSASQKQLINEQRLFSQNQFDIFLCHSFLDREAVEGLYLELSSMGYKVYVDWIIDSDIDRANVTKSSAERIQGRLKASKSLLLAISTNAAISKWVPWELGYVDGNTSNCAIIPVSASDYPPSSYDRTEYLKLYPFVEKPNDLSIGNKLYAIEAADKYVGLKEWIAGTKPVSQTRRIF